MTQEQLSLQSRDLDKLTTRNQQLYDQQMRLDIDKERVLDELATAKSSLEHLRNEAANLRAEKKIWESVQSRLTEDNKTLSVERAQLADLVANVQRIHGDLERSGENDRKRLETQIQMMESQTQELKVQLSQERETIRHVTLQRDIDMKDLQARLDKTTEQLAQARESLVGAETSKTHLQDRVEQLTRQLQGNEEKLAVYERRVSGVSAVTTAPAPDMPREQQLEQEVAELRSALKVAQVDLASSRTHVEQFQEISQANEAALAALNATHDQYKADAEAQTARLESEYGSLQEKLRAVEGELQQAKAKVTEIQQTLESERTAWTNDKKILEGTIVELSTSERISESDRTAHERDLRELEHRAIAAEERYAREVVTHAESLKNVENLRQQLTAAQATARQNLAEAASAQAKLEASEDSWKQQKEALEKEIADLNARYDDLSAQKALLYQHLDTVSSQAARIRQVANSSTENTSDEADANGDSDVKLAELRAVIGYLRKEKEIVDLQLELCKQENVRLKGQIDHLTRSLQEARNTLSEERERTIQAATSDAQHAEMLERINQLNILRESNATLRADCETYAKRARDLDARLKALSTELEPAKEEARVARAELQARDAQIVLLEGECKRWQERNTQLLSKYDRIDPAEVQSLKDEIDALKAQKAEVEKLAAERDTKFSEANARVEALEDALRRHKEAAMKNTEGFKQRLGQVNQERSRMNQRIKELESQVGTLTAERDTLRTGAGASADSDAPKELTAQLDALRQEKAALEKALADERAKPPPQPAPSLDQAALIASLQAERDRLLAEKEAPPNAGGSDVLKAQWAEEKAELSKARDEALARAKAADEEAKKAADDVRNLKQANEKFQVRIQDLHRARDRANTELAAAAEKAKNDMAVANAGNTEELVKRHAQELADLRALLNTQYEANLKAAVDAATLAAKAEATVASGDDATKAAIDTAIATREREFQAKLNDEIEKAVERGRMEQSAKSKLKDAQLVRSQMKVKDLEAQILEWRKAGMVPDSTNTPATTTATPATTTTPAASTSTVPSQATPASTTDSSTVPASSAPVRKQPTSGAVTLGPAEAAIRGRGRGISIRGAQRGISIRGRGGAPSPTATTAPPQQQQAIQIMGAAAKRAREDDASSDDSLAKRIRPAEAGASTPGPAAGVTNKPPVTIRRPQPPA
ncbi:TPR/MLP1/MLP2-like protein-domain-containing protein [Pisolithus marmoratus]|nr:TPR/MLP1/MLP2-like protein-domain-containing protein [Pisolithus marmoratus]